MNAREPPPVCRRVSTATKMADAAVNFIAVGNLRKAPALRDLHLLHEDRESPSVSPECISVMLRIILVLALLWQVLAYFFGLLSGEKIHPVKLTKRCNIPKVYVEKNQEIELPTTHPVVYVMEEYGRNWKLLKQVQRKTLLKEHGFKDVQLTSSNAHSHGKKIMTLAEYVESMPTTAAESEDTPPARPPQCAAASVDGDADAFKELSALYTLPKCGAQCTEKGVGGNVATTVSGVGGVGSGVSFHLHGPGFSEALVGKKRWFLYAPEYEPEGGFEAMVNTTVRSWVASDKFGSVHRRDQNKLDANDPFRLSYPAEEERPGTLHFYDCTIGKDEILYFPSQWMHATLNVDPYTYFVSVFLP